MNKKGSWLDLFFILPMLLFAAVVIVVVFVMYSQINTQMQASTSIATEGKTIMQNAENKYIGLFDNIFLVVFVSMLILILILASQVNVNPIFFPISIILYVLLIIVSAVVGNVFYDIMADPTMQTYALEFTVIPFVMNNLVKILLAEAVLLGVVMYARQQ